MLSYLVAVSVLAADPEITISDATVKPSLPKAGASFAPAALPAGGLSLYGIVGAPDIGAGYRQGFTPFELEARALFNYLELSGIVDATIKVPVVREGSFTLAPYGGLGFKLNSGARFYDRANFGSFALRPRVGANLSYATSETVHLVGLVDVPWAISLSVAGHQFTPTLGGGVEVHVGSSISILALGQIGVDIIKEPLGVTQGRVAGALRLGVGWRLF